MDRNLSNIKERALYISEYKEITREVFFEQIGMTYGSFKGKQKKSALNSDAIDRILSIYPDIDANWLITGKGEMLKEEVVYKSTDKQEGIPLLPFDAFAGLGDENIQGVGFSTIEERYVIPLFDGIKIDFMLPVRGSSMYPKYSSGDVVACKMVSELLFIQWNKVYVIDTFTQGVIMKRLKKCSKDNYIICKSDNTNYDEFELPKSEIRNIALVVGVVRLE